MKKLAHIASGLVLASSALLLSSTASAQLTGNVNVTNNYVWRGLTQSINEAAVQGGLDYAAESGFYVGTWVSNVSYDSDDVYSYEHDLYAGFAGETNGIAWDVGYLYYNYDENAGFDFGEIYGTVGIGNFSASLYILANAEPDEGPGQDFGFGEASYWSFDYAIPLASGAQLGLHAGYHEGDFVYAFNGVTDDYWDFNISIAKDGLAAMITQTSLGSDDDGDGFEDYASQPARDNDEVKFVISYSVDFEL
ncbi:MAG: TorF family putative porin [Pseudohongiellaceae bacterium]|jgi:uncharacterized protein (TIGR02001 family)